MDRKTFDALTRIMPAKEQRGDYYKVRAWMEDVEKEIADGQSLGSANRASLKPTCGHSSWAKTSRGCLDCQKENYIR